MLTLASGFSTFCTDHGSAIDHSRSARPCAVLAARFFPTPRTDILGRIRLRCCGNGPFHRLFVLWPGAALACGAGYCREVIVGGYLLGHRSVELAPWPTPDGATTPGCVPRPALLFPSLRPSSASCWFPDPQSPLTCESFGPSQATCDPANVRAASRQASARLSDGTRAATDPQYPDARPLHCQQR